MTEIKPMRILSLQAENVMVLKAIDITPDGNTIIIGGKNGAGKSAVLNCIKYLFGGKSAICAEPLRRGEKKGFAQADLGDLIVRRTFTADGGGKLIISSKDGATYKSPQAIADRLFNSIGFDPQEFVRMDPKKQLDTLKSLVGLDFSVLDAQRKELYEERTAVNRDGGAMRARFDAMPYHEDAGEAVSVAALMEELETAQATEQAESEFAAEYQAKSEVQDAQFASVENVKTVIGALERNLASARADLEREEISSTEATNACANAYDQAMRAREAIIPTDPIRERITSAESVNAKVRENEAKDAFAIELGAKRKEKEALTESITKIDEDKASQIAAAEFPVPGLGFNESGVLFEGFPFPQVCTSDQLRVSGAIGIALNPGFKVLMIRDGSLLDDESLKMFGEMAEENDAQVIIERVGIGKECSVVIEDGIQLSDEEVEERRQALEA